MKKRAVRLLDLLTMVSFGFLFFLLLLLSAGILGAGEIRIPSSHALTPNGREIVFGWAGDLWRVPVKGGKAERLTFHAAEDANPLVSRDGKWVFFNSERTGALQVFRMPIGGGVPEQMTFHTEGNFLEDLHPKDDRFLVSGLRDHAGRRPTRLLEKSFDPDEEEVMVFDATASGGRYSPDGQRILFGRSGSRTYRKGYQGSQAARIWLYDRGTGDFSEPVKDEGNCRYAIWGKDGRSFYFVTERSGSSNIWRHDMRSGKDEQVTFHEDDLIFGPVLSRDGRFLVYRHLFDLYRLELKEGGEPERIPLSYEVPLAWPEKELLTVTQTNDAVVTSSGLEWIVSVGGEIWAMDTVLREPHRLTESVEHETDLQLSKDGTYLYYRKDAGLGGNYWRMTKKRKDDFWWTATEFRHEPVTRGGVDQGGLKLSPDGKRLAYLEAPGVLWVAKADGTEAKKVVESWNFPDFSWSPDGSYLAYSVADGDFNNDVFVVRSDGEGEAVNVSRHPSSDRMPQWSPDGKFLSYVGRRFPNETVVFFVNLKREDFFRDGRDDLIESARKKMESDPAYQKKEEKEEPAADKKSPVRGLLRGLGLSKEDKDGEKKEELIDFEGISDRVTGISLGGMAIGEFAWMPDSSAMIFQSGGAIYQLEAKSGAKPKKWADGSGKVVRFDEAGRMFFLAGGVPSVLRSGKVDSYRFRVLHERDRKEHQRMGFRMAWKTMRDRFYDPALNHRNWDEIREKYEVAAMEALDKLTYARVIELMLGELNGSHTGFRPSDFPGEWKYQEAWKEETRHLGFRLDGEGRVTFVVPDGPVDREETRVKVGERVVAINGTELGRGVSVTRLINAEKSSDFRITVVAEGGEKREVLVRGVSFGEVRNLMKEEEMRNRRAMVDEKSDGKLGYLHIDKMMWAEFQKFEQHVYDRGFGKDGLIIDVRDNGGGFTADHLLTVLTQPLHAYTVPRDGVQGYPQDRHVYARWSKPVVVLCNENSFSNAEIFAHAIKTLKRGKVVGMPTAGGVISTGSATILDLGSIRVPFRGWFLPHDGEDMEMNGAVPDVLIDLQPGERSAGEDGQLKKAVEVLRKEVRWKKGELDPPIYRSERE